MFGVQDFTQLSKKHLHSEKWADQLQLYKVMVKCSIFVQKEL